MASVARMQNYAILMPSLTLYAFSQHAGNEQVLQTEAYLCGVSVGCHLRKPEALSRGHHVGQADAEVRRVLNVDDQITCPSLFY